VSQSRDDGVGQEYLYVRDRTGGRSGPGSNSLFHHKISDLAVTERCFEPRYGAELTKASEFSDRLGFGRGRPVRRHPIVTPRRR
jgi:hypothetical protein